MASQSSLGRELVSNHYLWPNSRPSATLARCGVSPRHPKWTIEASIPTLSTRADEGYGIGCHMSSKIRTRLWCPRNWSTGFCKLSDVIIALGDHVLQLQCYPARVMATKVDPVLFLRRMNTVIFIHHNTLCLSALVMDYLEQRYLIIFLFLFFFL